VEIERLTELSPGQLRTVIADSEAQGLSFVRRLDEEWAGGVNRFDRPGEALFVACDGINVIGVGGLNVDPYANDIAVGRVRHLYVLSAYRRRGIGERLVTTIVDAARGRFQTLRLHTSNPDAARLYERLGFARHADATHCTHTLEIAPRVQRETTAP
jgi:GNAT superfamily N-acetyltransferase